MGVSGGVGVRVGIGPGHPPSALFTATMMQSTLMPSSPHQPDAAGHMSNSLTPRPLSAHPTILMSSSMVTVESSEQSPMQMPVDDGVGVGLGVNVADGVLVNVRFEPGVGATQVHTPSPQSWSTVPSGHWIGDASHSQLQTVAG